MAVLVDLSLPPAVGFISRERVSKKMVGGSCGPDPAEIARGEALLTSAADVLDRHLADKQWIAQDRLTLADLAIAAPLMHTAAAELPVAGYRHLQAWLRGCRRWTHGIRRRRRDRLVCEARPPLDFSEMRRGSNEFHHGSNCRERAGELD